MSKDDNGTVKITKSRGRCRGTTLKHAEDYKCYSESEICFDFHCRKIDGLGGSTVISQ